MTDPEIVAEARRHHECFVCRWIVEDYEKNGKLTGHPNDYMSGGIFPRESKEKHVQLEIGTT